MDAFGGILKDAAVILFGANKRLFRLLAVDGHGDLGRNKFQYVLFVFPVHPGIFKILYGHDADCLAGNQQRHSQPNGSGWTHLFELATLFQAFKKNLIAQQGLSRAKNIAGQPLAGRLPGGRLTELRQYKNYRRP
jgi:hypothetical protein